MNIDQVYKQVVEKILREGKKKSNRTATDAVSVSGCMIDYDMANGFPLLTTKKMAWKTIRVELEGFIKGRCLASAGCRQRPVRAYKPTGRCAGR